MQVRDPSFTGRDPWWKAAKGNVHREAFTAVRRIENENSEVFDRFVKLEALYDPNTPDGGDVGHVTENVIASGVDTMAAMIGEAEIFARFLTDGADWHQTRRAKELEFYAEERQVECKIPQRCRTALKEALKKGAGLTKSYERFGVPRVDFVAIENVVVDPAEHREGRETRQFHQWDYVDADELIALYPEHEEAINNTRGRVGEWSRMRSNWRPPEHQVCVLYSYRKPIGVRGQKGYKAGRETVCIEGADLYDEEWHETEFPFGMMVCSERLKSFYPISVAERVMGIQYALNKRHWQIDRTLDQNAVLTSYLRPADANMQVKTTAIGRHGIVVGDYPHTPVPPVVHPETYGDLDRKRAAGLQEMGVNEMAARATKPSGVETGRAIREYTHATTTRYSTQERGYEELVLTTIWNTLMVCKRLGKSAPTTIRRGRFAPTKLRWKDVDPTEMRIQMRAANTSPRQPWGRTETVLELAQAGLVSTDSARRMLDNLDLDQELSLYSSALEAIEFDLDAIAKGHVVIPDPSGNHAMMVWRATNEYLKWSVLPKVPEEVLEVIRQYFEIAADYQAQAAMPANDNTTAQPTAALAPDVAPMLAS